MSDVMWKQNDNIQIQNQIALQDSTVTHLREAKKHRLALTF